MTTKATASYGKRKIWDDLWEFGESTVKTTTQELRQTFSPLKILEGIVGGGNENASIEKNDKNELKREQNSTPLDTEKLRQKYQEQDKQKEEALRQRLFQLVKRGEEEVLQRQKQQEAEKQRMEAYKEQEKKRKEEERKRQEALVEVPKGKIRRSIFSPKKVAQRQQAEVKPAAGKQ
jgi:hypothetical protein